MTPANDAANPTIHTLNIADLLPDNHNANKGTARGKKMLERSLKKNGAGRSVLIDKNNVTLAGNKTLEAAKKKGIKKVLVVETDGDTLVAVRRKDVEAGGRKANELALADNRVNQVDLDFDKDVLKDIDADLSELWDPIELDRLLEDGANSREPNTIELQPPPKMMWVLLGIPMNRFDVVQEHLAALESESEVSCQSARNE